MYQKGRLGTSASLKLIRKCPELTSPRDGPAAKISPTQIVKSQGLKCELRTYPVQIIRQLPPELSKVVVPVISPRLRSHQDDYRNGIGAYSC